MPLAQRNLFQNKVRLSLSAVGVALSVMLILILNGFLTGVHRQATAYLDNSPGSVVVVQEGIRNFFAASSILPPGTVTSVRETKGVSQALGIASQFVIFELHDEKQGAQVVGYDPKSGGGPWELSEGRDVRADDEAVVERIEEDVSGVTAQTRVAFAEQERRLVNDMAGDLLAIMNLAGFMTGLAVVALTVYTATLARRSEYGVLKALGARNSRLYGVVLAQALFSVALGFVVGLAFTLLLSAIVPALGFNLPLQVGAASLLKVGSASLVIAALAAVLPIRQIAGLDPAAVFRG